jgi:hypothetical protein
VSSTRSFARWNGTINERRVSEGRRPVPVRIAVAAWAIAVTIAGRGLMALFLLRELWKSFRAGLLPCRGPLAAASLRALVQGSDGDLWVRQRGAWADRG